MNSTFHIFIDSDGVLADFDGHFYAVAGSRTDELPKGKVWKIIGALNKTDKPFFRSLPKMPDADILVDFVTATFANRAVLTATGFSPNDVEQQKREWYAELYPDLAVFCVRKSPDKAEQFAAPNAILIDDREKSIDPWVAAGGIGILHTDALSTIEKLKEILG